MNRKRMYVVALILTLILTIIVSAVYLAPHIPSLLSQPTIVISITFYNEQGVPVQLPRDVELQAQVFAATAEGSRFGDVRVEILRGRVNGSIIILKPEGVFGEIVREWVDYIRNKGLDPRTASSIQINIWVINTSSRAVISRHSHYYPYEPVAVASGRSVTIEVAITIPPTKTGTSQSYSGQGDKVGRGDSVRLDASCVVQYSWERLWIVMPENYTGKPYVMYDPVDATYYMKTPVLAVINHAYTSVGASININAIYKTGWSVSIGAGLELQKYGLSSPSVTIYKAGNVREDHVYFYEWLPTVNPWETRNIYVWARPIAEFFREMVLDTCIGMYEPAPTGYEKLDAYVKSVRIVDKWGSKYYDGGDEYGLPDWIYRWLYDSSVTSDRYIGGLPPGGKIALEMIIRNYIDTCGVDFETSIPVGAIAATLLASKGAPAAFTGFLASVSASVGHLTFIITGGVENIGPNSAYLYFRQINFAYKANPLCFYKVPISMVFIIL